MGRKDVIDAFKDKAVRFLEEAERDVNSGWYDFAIFHTEQALQLGLKAVITNYSGKYPFTHNLRELISLASEYFPELKELRNRYHLEIDFLINAYTGSRYTSGPYSEASAKHLIEVVKEFLKVIGLSIK